MKASKFFTSRMKQVTLRKISDKDGWETDTDFTVEITALPQVKMSGIDPEMSIPYAIQSTVDVFVHRSDRLFLEDFTIGDGVIVDGLDYEILDIVKIESNGRGMVLEDFPVKIVGVRK